MIAPGKAVKSRYWVAINIFNSRDSWGIVVSDFHHDETALLLDVDEDGWAHILLANGVTGFVDVEDLEEVGQ